VKISEAKIVVMGGGTGTYVALSGLKEFTKHLIAVVTVTDTGGSSGRLRDQFGFLPVGDLRQGLAALASDGGEAWIRKLLLYRFSRGEGLNGHNLGNLVLTALTDLTGSEAKAVEVAAQIFRLAGRVLPVSLDNIQLVATYEDGTRVVGEHEIDEPAEENQDKQIINLQLVPQASIYEEADKAIREADLILIGPGDLYTSLLPHLLVEGVKEALTSRKGRLVYAINLMTRLGQTRGYTASTHLEKLTSFLGSDPDFVLLNKAPIAKHFTDAYAKQGEFPVADDLEDSSDYQVIRQDLLADEEYFKSSGDILKRSFLRHHPKKLAQALVDFLSS
jgi:uncharacterized cofD-like protein